MLAGFEEPPETFQAPTGFTRSRTEEVQHFVVVEYDAATETAVGAEDIARVPFEDADLELLVAS